MILGRGLNGVRTYGEKGMIGVALGKRFERLLFFTAPISLAAIIVSLVAFASSKQSERIEARCVLQAADVFEENLPKLKREWVESEKDEYRYPGYKHTLHRPWINAAFPSACYKLIETRIDEEFFKVAPEKLIPSMRDRAKNLLRTPLSLYGVALPQTATLDLFVTKVSIDLPTLTRILQVVLLPVLLLWLGSLYGTRYRESLTTAHATSLAEVFPHIINIYPAFDQPTPRKKSSLAPYEKSIACFIYACTRVGLLLIFILPPVFAYEYSLVVGALEEFSFLYVAAGAVVAVFFLSNVLAEFFPTHYQKVFPDPRRGLDF